MNLMKQWKMIFLIIAIIFALGLIFINFSGHDYSNYVEGTNIRLGLEFRGGTIFQIELQQEVSNEEINRISNIISKRIDPSGLQDFTVTPIGNQFISIEVSENDPEKLEIIETRIRQQGKFEAALNGETVFTGDEIIRVLRGSTSYGVYTRGENSYEWSLPFILNDKATNSFKEKTFHQCTVIGYSANGQPEYECEKTIFFLDKPEATIIMSEDQYVLDREEIYIGNSFLNIPAESDIDEIIEDSQLTVIVYDGNLDLNEINTDKVIVSSDLDKNVIALLNNFEVIEYTQGNKPWIWDVLNAKQIISLTPGITNENVSSIEEAESFSTLRITGQRSDPKEARKDLDELAILLESGSLPTPVKTISKQTISPTLGEAFLSTVIIMGIIALITVSLVIVIRYRMIKLIIPILVIGISEVLLNLGFIALIGRPLDLAAFAGLIAAIGTGLDSEIVITDEMLSRTKKIKGSIIERAKAAIFIIMTSAFTMIGVMGPIVLFSRNFPGLEKLYGFAVVAIVGALIGVFITRPAFTKIMEKIVGDEEKN